MAENCFECKNKNVSQKYQML